MSALTMREQLALSAPAEPQPWFEPVMPPRPTVRPLYARGWTWEQLEVARGIGDWLSRSDAMDRAPEVVEWDDQRNGELAQVQVWKTEREKQRCVQWPWAWADAVLEAASKVGGT